MPDIQVTRRDGPLGTWRFATASPAPRLRGHVTRYLGYRERTSFHRRREAPGTVVPLIINLGRPLSLGRPDAPPRAYPEGFVAGLSESAGIVDSGGEQFGIQVDFTPIGAQLFLGMPLREITGLAVSLSDLLGPGATGLVERLRLAPDWRRRFDMLDAFIANRFAESPPVPPDLVWAWGRLSDSRGALPIAALAAEMSCSRKHLSARFTTHLGLPPKTLAVILRFSGVVRDLGRAPESLAVLAARHGYYDQAHLARDFRRLAGITPSDHLLRSAGGFGVIDDWRGLHSSKPPRGPNTYGGAMNAIHTPSLNPFLFCADVDASLAFVVEAFGLQPGEVARDADGNGVNATAHLGDQSVFLSRSHPGEMQAANTMPMLHALVMMYVDDVDAVCARAKAAGARVDYPPQDMPYGQRECGIRDLDGNLWSVATLLPRS